MCVRVGGCVCVYSPFLPSLPLSCAHEIRAHKYVPRTACAYVHSIAEAASINFKKKHDVPSILDILNGMLQTEGMGNVPLPRSTRALVSISRLIRLIRNLPRAPTIPNDSSWGEATTRLGFD